MTSHELANHPSNCKFSYGIPTAESNPTPLYGPEQDDNLRGAGYLVLCVSVNAKESIHHEGSVVGNSYNNLRAEKATHHESHIH
jgi:hypothetical protein